MDLRGPLRLFRAVLVTAAAMSLAAAGHVLGGGALPAPAIMAVLAALLLAPVAWLAGRQLSFLALFGVLGSGQLMLHEAFVSLSTRVLSPPSLAEQTSHHGQAAGAGLSAAVTASMPVQIGNATDSPLMLAGHLLALLATAWLLRRGEVALWQLLAWLRPLVQLPRPVLIVPVRRRPLMPGRVFVPVPRTRPRDDTLRGPPAAATRCAVP